MSKPKFCYKCKTTKTLDDFYKDSSRSNGHCNRCKVCDRKHDAELSTTELYKARHLKNQTKFIANHPERSNIYRQASKIELNNKCERCSATSKRLIRHHPDYNQPQNIITLCDLCHRAVHKELLNV
jgi:hypothetical protein